MPNYKGGTGQGFAEPRRYREHQIWENRQRDQGGPDGTGGGFGGGGRGFGGGSQPNYMTRGVPAAPRMNYQVPGFEGMDAGGSQQIGDLRIDNADRTGMYGAATNLYGDIATSQIGAEASMYNALLNLLGIQGGQDVQRQLGTDQYATQRYGTDASREVALGGQEVDRYGIDSGERVALGGQENQYNIADLTSGRDLEGLLAGVQGRSDVATIGADSARDVARIRDLDSSRGHDEFNASLQRYDDYMASRGQGGLGSVDIPSGYGMEYLDPSAALNAAYAANARGAEAATNSGGGGGSSPQASAVGQRADLQEAMANQDALTSIIPAYANANNQNRLGLLAAQAEARRAATADRDGILNFLSSMA